MAAKRRTFQVAGTGGGHIWTDGEETGGDNNIDLDPAVLTFLGTLVPGNVFGVLCIDTQRVDIYYQEA